MGTETKRLGKIKSVKFGHVGYQDMELGIQFELSGESWGTVDNRSFWDAIVVKCDENTQWGEVD